MAGIRKYPEGYMEKMKILLSRTPLSLKQIAYDMEIEQNTAKFYAARIYKLNGVSGRIELMHRELTGAK